MFKGYKYNIDDDVQEINYNGEIDVNYFSDIVMRKIENIGDRTKDIDIILDPNGIFYKEE